MNSRFAQATLILYLMQYVMYARADDTNNNNTDDDSIVCGAPPCQDGCYNSTYKVDGKEVDLCTIAPVGQYSPGDAKLYPCPKGTYASVAGSNICIVCPIGTAAPREGSSMCTPCDEGLYVAETGSVECKKCNPSKYFGRGSTGTIRENSIDYCLDPNVNQLECGNSTSPCSGRCYIVGNVSMKTEFAMRSCSIVPKGFYSPHDDELIYACPIGMYSLEGSNECNLCTPGSATTTAGSGSCQQCPQSTYASGFGSASCSGCNSSLYAGTGSFSIFRDDDYNISYCLKPIQETSGNLSTVSTYVPSLAPSQSFTLNPVNSSWQQPSTSPSGTVEITIQPTSIFDVISVSTRSPQIIKDFPSSIPNGTVFNNTNTSRSYEDVPMGTRVILFFVVIAMMALVWWIHRHCKNRRFDPYREPLPEEEIIPRRRKKGFARTPPADGNNRRLSPTFPVPKIISTTKIVSKDDHVDDDEDSEIGVYIEDDSVM